MVLCPLSLLLVVRKTLQALCRNVLRPVVARADEMHMRRGSFNIFEMLRLKFCTDSNVNKMNVFVTPAVVRKAFCSRKEYYGDRDTLSGDCSASFIAHLVMRDI